MVTEEPSVIAAASYAAKLITASGGFRTTIHNRQMIGQVILYDIVDLQKATETILTNQSHLLRIANDAHPSIVTRGGGARELWVEHLTDDNTVFLVVYFSVDTQEAMGANMVNTMAEALKTPLAELTRGTVLMAILSNYATNSLVTATCQIDSQLLSTNYAEAETIAMRIAKASQIAQIDTYRATTHNKGIFNGIDALILASGNDWRAIEAGAHAFATRTGRYKGLSTWEYDKTQQKLIGTLTLPMPIGTKGGSIGLNPTVKIAHDMLGNPTAKELASIIVSLGLAQNLAALKALTGKGIQAGHMALQAKSLLLMVGAHAENIEILIPKLLAKPHLNLDSARQVLAEYHTNSF